MPPAPDSPATLLENSLASGRIHSAYLISGAGPRPRETALAFARGIACTASEGVRRPCEACPACRRSRPADEPVEIDGSGKSGPLYRHIGEHADLYWVERGAEDTRVRIDQVRAVQGALRLGTNEGGRRAAVIADAEWLNHAAQNALLRLLEEPPERTTLILVSRSPAILLATIRSRCLRVAFPAEEPLPLRGPEAEETTGDLVARLDGIARLGLPELLDWAEEYRGPRAIAAAQVETLLAVGSQWLRERITEAARAGRRDLRGELDAFDVLGACRRDLVQRNAQPQMVAERGLFAVRGAVRT
jgi:hypothetical protein